MQQTTPTKLYLPGRRLAEMERKANVTHGVRAGDG